MVPWLFHTNKVTLSTITTATAKEIKLIRPVSHVKGAVESDIKPERTDSGHFNRWDILSKMAKLEQLLSDSNLDYLCLSKI